QAVISKSQKRIKKLELRPDPEPLAADIVGAIENADMIVIGPGSLYTSILPNLLIPKMTDVLAASKAVKVFVANIMTYEGETRGYDLPDLLKALDEHSNGKRLYGVVLVNDGKHGDTGMLTIKERNAHAVHFDLAAYANAPFKVVPA